VSVQGERACGPVTREDDVHRAAGADGPFALAAASTVLAAVLGASKIELTLLAEERQLHRARGNHRKGRGNVVYISFRAKFASFFDVTPGTSTVAHHHYCARRPVLAGERCPITSRERS